MRAAHVVATIDDPTAGPSLSVSQLCQALLAQGVQIDLHTVAGWRSAPPPASLDGVHRHAQDFASAPVLGRLCLSSTLAKTLKRDAPHLDVIHTHGLWLMPNVYPAWAAKGTGVATIISPRGMLGSAALEFSSWKKSAFWHLAQKKAVMAARCLHATSQSELEEIRAFGIKAPVAIIPNGVDVAPLQRPAPSGPARTLLTLGRIHPKKGLRNLVEAWAELEPRFSDWRLRIVGPSEGGHAEELGSLVRSLGLRAVTIEGPLFGDDKANAYREADLFVLPTLNENFALTVAESLAAGVPVVATKGAPWQGLETERCGWWIDIGATPMAAALNVAMAAPRDQLTTMGERGHAWMAREFSWGSVAQSMVGVYRWLGGDADAPAYVRFT